MRKYFRELVELANSREEEMSMLKRRIQERSGLGLEEEVRKLEIPYDSLRPKNLLLTVCFILSLFFLSIPLFHSAFRPPSSLDSTTPIPNSQLSRRLSVPLAESTITLPPSEFSKVSVSCPFLPSSSSLPRSRLHIISLILMLYLGENRGED